MAARLSTGLVKSLMDTGSFKSLFALGFIDIYSGTQPALPDAAPTGTHLVRVYSDGTTTGLSWSSTAPAGVLSKLGSQTWSGTVLANGTAGWFRLVSATDGGALSTTDCRYDGACATSGGEMTLGSLSLIAGAPFVIPSGTFTLPQQ
jgi:hypothetical protein